MMKMKKKDDTVKLDVNPAFNLAEQVLKTAWIMHDQECVITSGKDGKHSTLSAHYSGNALDLRIWGIKNLPEFAENLADALLECCGPGYYVVLEGDHIHLEYSAGKPNIKGWKAGKYVYGIN